MRMQVNPGPASWSSPHGRGSFRGRGPFYGKTATPNKVDWASDSPMLAARLFVGFNVGSRPTWNVDQLVELVERVREDQGEKPDASFVAQRGIYTSSVDGETVTEDGAQVIVLDLETPEAQFKEEMVQLAEVIARDFEQELVIVEFQKGGLVVQTFGVTP